MIEFITESGIPLDIKKNSEFLIEYEQPILDSEKIPAPQSTTIELPLSQTNKEVFGFIPGISLTPKNQKIKGWLNYNSMNILHGTLEFDSFEDNTLKCSFNGFDLSELWSSNIDIQGAETGAKTHDGTGDILSPPIIHKKMVAKMAVPNEARYIDGVGTTECSNEKYRNYPGHKVVSLGEANPSTTIKCVETFCPCVKIAKIFTDKKIVFQNYPPEFNQIALLAPYNPTTKEVTAWSAIGVELTASQWPEISYSDIIKSVLDIFCCTLFASGDDLIVKSFDNISNTYYALDWSDKTSDHFTTGIYHAKKYSFEFSNSDEFKETEGVSDINLTDFFTNLTESEDYETIKIHETGDIISRKAHALYNYILRPHGQSDTSLIATLVESDIISHDTRKKSGPDGPSEKFESKCKFKLVASVPDRYVKDESITRIVETKMKPVIDLPSVDTEKDSSAVYIGLIKPNCQMTDGKYYYSNNSVVMDLASLRPDDLYYNYHNQFAEWLNENHETVKIKLNLSYQDIANFRMYKPVYLMNAYWIISKISFTFKMSSGIVETEGEFIRL